MPNEDYGLYNYNLKMNFLKQWCENKSQKTKQEYEKTFRITSEIEENLLKDIFELNVLEFIELLKGFKCTTVKSLKAYLNILKLYCYWCKKHGYLKDEKIVATTFDKVDLEKYLNKIGSVEKFISYDELIELTDHVDNAQDAVIFALVYEGIKGTNNSEITNLKVRDYTMDGLVTIGGKNPRQIQVHDKTLELMNEAKNQVYYEKMPRKTAQNEMRSTRYELPMDSPYLIRQNPKKARSEGGESYDLYNGDCPANWQTINARIKKIAVNERIDRPYLTSQSLLQSGMLYKILEIEIEKGKGKLSNEDYKSVMVQYGGKPTNYSILKEMYESVFQPIRKAEIYKIEKV